MNNYYCITFCKMKIVKWYFRSLWWYLNIEHYCIYHDNIYYSWEYNLSYKFLFKRWRFVKYTPKEFAKRCRKVTWIYEIPYIDPSKFCNLQENWYNCYEIICLLIKNMWNFEAHKEERNDDFIKMVNDYNLWKKHWKRWFIAWTIFWSIFSLLFAIALLYTTYDITFIN